MIRRILLVLSYAAAGIGIIVATIILVALGQGYSYNLKTGQFSINGLLVMISSPPGAEVLINGRLVHRGTPYRSTLVSGSYNAELRKDGYRTWHKQVDILAYEVTSLDHILLLPTNIPSEVASPNQTVASLVASHDRRHFAYTTPGSDAAVWVLNSDRKSGTKVYTAQAASPDHPAEQLTGLSWSEDGSHLLIVSQLGATPTYQVVSGSGGTPINLTDLFRMDLSGLSFSSYDWRELYWISPEGLRKLNVEAKTSSAVLATKVSSFGFIGDHVMYVQSTALGKSLSYMDRSGNNVRQLIESLAESNAYQLQYVNYRGRDVLAVLPQKSSTVTVYFDILSANPTSRVLSSSTNHISFSDDGRNLVYYDVNGYGSYDLEKNILSSVKLTGASLTCLTWFDLAHVLICHDGKVAIAELDGANISEIAPIVPGGVAYGMADLRHILYLSNTVAGTPAVYASDLKK